jgi:adenylylsulfate kinase
MNAGLVAWFAGLSGSGKTTIANAAATILSAQKIKTEIVDGDKIRGTQGSHLGFSRADVAKSNELAIAVCLERRQTCDVVLVPRISPSRQGRQFAKSAFGEGFIEVYIKASIETVIKRDPKGLYQRAQANEIEALIGMPGVLPFEVPGDPDLILDTEAFDQEHLAWKLADYISAYPKRDSKQ